MLPWLGVLIAPPTATAFWLVLFTQGFTGPDDPYAAFAMWAALPAVMTLAFAPRRRGTPSLVVACGISAAAGVALTYVTLFVYVFGHVWPSE